MADDSRYRMSLEQFERETPRVHARPVDPGDPDGEMEPGTAFAMVEQPEPPPNPNSVEGLIAGFGKLGSAAAGSSTVGRRAQASQRALIAIVALPFLIAVIVVLLNH